MEPKLHPKVETEWISTLKKMGIIKKDDELENQESDGQPATLSDRRFEQMRKDHQKDDDDEDLDQLLDDLDEDDEKAFAAYRNQRLIDLQIQAAKKTFGEVLEITKQNYVEEVNNAGDGIYVVLHVYKPGNMLCSLLNQFLSSLAFKFRNTKFLKSIVDLCIPNFPEQNLPAIFVYCDGKVIKQFLGETQIGDLNMKCEDLEWILSKTGAMQSSLTEDPRKARNRSTRFVMSIAGESSDEE